MGIINRSVLFILVVILIIVLGVFLWYGEYNMPDNARIALNQYLAWRYSAPPPISQQTRASIPAKFERSLSGASYDASVFFRTTYDYRNKPVINLPGMPTVTPGHEPAINWGPERAIPFPPRDVWCVVVKPENEAAQILFVALHQEMYIAAWLVHTPSGEQSIAELKQNLASIGCALKLEQ